MLMPLSMPPEGGACMLNGMRRSYSCGVSKANTTSVQRRAHRIVYTHYGGIVYTYSRVCLFRRMGSLLDPVWAYIC
jgi:hypothetical protein